MSGSLLHLITTADWRTALARRSLASPAGVGFVHLSTPAQVTLPANRLFAGRRDVLLLAVDPVDLDVRYEPGLPDDPPDLRFPHAYGRVPTSAVVAVLPYRPDANGTFAPPPLPPARTDVTGRVAVVEPSLLRRTATAEVAVRGGIAVLTSPLAASHQSNQLLLGATGTGADPTGADPTDPQPPVDATSVMTDADRVLGGAGLPHRVARLAGPHAAATAHALQKRGWTVLRVVTMAAPARPGPAEPVAQVDLATLRPTLTATWRRRIPNATPAHVAQLVDRSRAVEAVTDLRYLAVRQHDAVVASALLMIDGATALLDEVETDLAHRRHGYGNDLVTAALAIAAEAGCDLVTLDALADDFPRAWYRRRGFTEVGEVWAAALR